LLENVPEDVMLGKGRAVLTLLVTLMLTSHAGGEPVTVRQAEGVIRGFLTLHELDGTALADGDLIQTSRGARVTTRLVFHFKDGSVHDETAVFSQRQQFQLISDHLVQKGPSFPQPLDMSIDVAAGRVIGKYTDDHGQEKTATEQLKALPDLANGLVLTLLKNVLPASPPKSVSFVAATPEPRLIKLDISVAGREAFSTGALKREATHYVLKANIGGISGLVAPLVGKQPPDAHVWILNGDAPAFVKAEQPFYNGGPVWRIELVSPVWPRAQTTQP
jgi:hypothetical protein